MRARTKKIPELTADNIVAVLVQGRYYMLNAIALKFGRRAEEISPFVDLLVESGRMVRHWNVKGHRYTFCLRPPIVENVTPGRLVPTPSRIAWGFSDR